MTVIALALALLAPQQDPKPILEKLGVVLKVTERPAPPKAPGSSVSLTLLPQDEESQKAIVSFGLPFPPDTLTDDRLVRVLGADGQEIAAYTHPLAHWWIDGKKGAIRSTLVQFPYPFSGKSPQKVTVVWDKARTKSREKPTLLAETQTVRTEDGFDFHAPRVLVLLPPAWLCASRVAWQQVPAG
ncbi:MAG TPA: hypothetical protein VEN81_04525, partial [Planctomycetota bacterium]|nr:hypothetical protein [Planctomycetota bacterium]